ncbi:MAG: hypothetical protein M5R36_12140 [Deltaproteobacteria bacterium]|nr:hypothetical protein [Deltaproteobacteria bacterium]
MRELGEIRLLFIEAVETHQPQALQALDHRQRENRDMAFARLAGVTLRVPFAVAVEKREPVVAPAAGDVAPDRRAQVTVRAARQVVFVEQRLHDVPVPPELENRRRIRPADGAEIEREIAEPLIRQVRVQRPEFKTPGARRLDVRHGLRGRFVLRRPGIVRNAGRDRRRFRRRLLGPVGRQPDHAGPRLIEPDVHADPHPRQVEFGMIVVRETRIVILVPRKVVREMAENLSPRRHGKVRRPVASVGFAAGRRRDGRGRQNQRANASRQKSHKRPLDKSRPHHFPPRAGRQPFRERPAPKNIVS